MSAPTVPDKPPPPPISAEDHAKKEIGQLVTNYCAALQTLKPASVRSLFHLDNERELKEKYTVVIVTHNMQQAARVSDQTAFFNLAAQGKPGKLIEIGPTEKIFSNPDQKATEDYITGRFG